MNDVVLAIDGLTAGYGGSPAIRGVSLSIAEGEVLALLGANGAGKTTTLRAVSGLVKLGGGTVTYRGRPLNSTPPPERARLGIAHVPEGRGIFYGMTVAEHMRLAHRGEAVDADVAFTYFPALAKLQHTRAGLLSGGEQQMLAIGRALARRPKLLMLDELSLGLAPIIVENILPVIRRYALESGCSVLLVEQHVHLALEFADRGAVMSHGEVVANDRASALIGDEGLLLSSYLGGSGQGRPGFRAS